MITQLISSNLELHRLNTGRVVPVVAARTMLSQRLFQHQGYISAALVLGGVDSTGAHIYSISPHGNTDKLPYTTMGSGCLAAMSVFESRWRPDMDEEEGKKLVRDAIAAGVFNDLGSGSNIDLCVITKNGAKYLRTYEEANKKGQRSVILFTLCESFDQKLTFYYLHFSWIILSNPVLQLYLNQRFTNLRYPKVCKLFHQHLVKQWIQLRNGR